MLPSILAGSLVSLVFLFHFVSIPKLLFQVDFYSGGSRRENVYAQGLG